MQTKTLVRVAPAVLSALLLVTACGKKDAQPAAAPAAEPAYTAAAPTAAEPAAPATAAASDAGVAAYNMYCVTCHGATGKGDGLAAASLTPKPADFSAGAFKFDPNGNGEKGDIDDIKAIVRDGAAKHGGSPLMAPWPMLSPDQLQAVAEHVKSFQEG